jgi:hypothetical protein
MTSQQPGLVPTSGRQWAYFQRSLKKKNQAISRDSVLFIVTVTTVMPSCHHDEKSISRLWLLTPQKPANDKSI